MAEVEVDPETGVVKLRKFITAHDVGTVHNPLSHQGQIDGAVVQGVGYALMEELLSEEGQISTLSMGDVKTPTIQDIPELATVLVEAPGGNGPYGAKTIGEQPLPPVAPAIANAVYDGGCPNPRPSHYSRKSARRFKEQVNERTRLAHHRQLFQRLS